MKKLQTSIIVLASIGASLYIKKLREELKELEITHQKEAGMIAQYSNEVNELKEAKQKKVKNHGYDLDILSELWFDPILHNDITSKLIYVSTDDELYFLQSFAYMCSSDLEIGRYPGYYKYEMITYSDGITRATIRLLDTLPDFDMEKDVVSVRYLMNRYTQLLCNY